MSVIYIMIPIALILAGLAVLAFIFAVRGGQLDDLDTPPLRVLFDDETSPSQPPPQSQPQPPTRSADAGPPAGPDPADPEPPAPPPSN